MVLAEILGLCHQLLPAGVAGEEWPLFPPATAIKIAVSNEPVVGKIFRQTPKQTDRQTDRAQWKSMKMSLEEVFDKRISLSRDSNGIPFAVDFFS